MSVWQRLQLEVVRTFEKSHTVNGVSPSSRWMVGNDQNRRTVRQIEFISNRIAVLLQSPDVLVWANACGDLFQRYHIQVRLDKCELRRQVGLCGGHRGTWLLGRAAAGYKYSQNHTCKKNICAHKLNCLKQPGTKFTGGLLRLQSELANRPAQAKTRLF